MEIAVVDCSTHYGPEAAATAVEAINEQIREHVAPAWSRAPLPVVVYKDDDVLPDDALVVHIHNDTRVTTDMGNHFLTRGGRPSGVVYVDRVEKNNMPVSAIVSHEVVEAFIDPYANLWIKNEGDGTYHDLELCDPVERDTYAIKVGGVPIQVSNFALPAWYDHKPAEGAAFDHMRLLTAPFKSAPGGYSTTVKKGRMGKIWGPKDADWEEMMADHRLGRRAKRAGTTGGS